MVTAVDVDYAGKDGFGVVYELLRHSTLRSTLDIYTQAITPAKRAAQAAVLSLVFPEMQRNAAAIEIDQS